MQRCQWRLTQVRAKKDLPILYPQARLYLCTVTKSSCLPELLATLHLGACLY